MANIKIGDGFRVNKNKVLNSHWTHLSHCTDALFKIIFINSFVCLSCSCCPDESMADFDDIGTIFIPSKYITIKKTEYKNTDT